MKRLKYVDIDLKQLKIGMYITLDLSWAEHPFLTSSFKLQDQKQLETIHRLGLKSIRYCPEKSDHETSTPDEIQLDIPATKKEIDLTEEAVLVTKKTRVQQLNYHKQSVVKCEKELLEAAQVINKINRDLCSCPAESIIAAGGLVRQMTDSLLTDKDVTIHAMNDEIAGQKVYHHALNVSILSMILAKELKLSKETINVVGMGGIFHDIGKTKMPDKILHKTGRLTVVEKNFLKLHPVHGKKIAEEVKLPSPIVDIIHHHHETCDGAGYPDGLDHQSILLPTQIVAVANTFDNLCNKKTLTPYEAITTLYARHRAHFDKKILGVFIQKMGVYPPGTIIMLSNDHWGVVVSVNMNQPQKPTVLIYDPEIPKQDAIIIDLNEEPELSIISTYHPKDLPREVLNYLNPRERHTFYFHSATNSNETCKT